MKYDLMAKKAKEKVQFYGNKLQKEEAVEYLKLYELLNYEITLIDAKLLDFEYHLQNPSESLSNTSSLFRSTIEDKYNSIDLEKTSVEEMANKINGYFKSFVD